MAATIQSVFPLAYDATLDQETDLGLLKRALDGDRGAAAKCTRDGADFIVQARADGSADAFAAIDLTARGVTFPAGFMRTVECELYASGATVATESGYIHKREMIVGGTTPVLGIVIGAIDTNMVGAVGGFTGADVLLDFVLATNNVTVQITNEGAVEINNFILKVKVGKLQPVILGV